MKPTSLGKGDEDQGKAPTLHRDGNRKLLSDQLGIRFYELDGGKFYEVDDGIKPQRFNLRWQAESLQARLVRKRKPKKKPQIVALEFGEASFTQNGRLRRP